MKRILLSIVFLAVSAGCSTYSPWGQISVDAPYDSSGGKVETWQRSETPSPLMVVGAPVSQITWMINGKRVHQHKVAKAIDAYLEQVGYTRQQQTIGSYTDDLQHRVAKHRFFIVSLDPIVVIMTQHNYGVAENKSTYELAGRLNNQVLSSSPFVNGYHYGSQVNRSSQYTWFSPDMHSGPTEVPRDTSGWRIETDRCSIVIIPSTSGAWNSVQRTR